MESRESVEVVSAENRNLPWSLAANSGRLRFFAGQPGTVRVRTPSRQWDFSLTLPQVGTALWEPPEKVLRGIPPPRSGDSLASTMLWRWLALAGLLCLLVDWVFFGRRPMQTAAVESTIAPPRAGPVWNDADVRIMPKTPERQVTR